MNEFSRVDSDFRSSQDGDGLVLVRPGSGDPTFVPSRAEGQSSSTREIGELSVNTDGALEEPKPAIVNYIFQVELFGVMFLVEIDSEGVLIHHHEYAISGEGASLRDAIEDLLGTARELKGYFARQDITTLDGSAIKFRGFLLDELTL